MEKTDLSHLKKPKEQAAAPKEVKSGIAASQKKTRMEKPAVHPKRPKRGYGTTSKGTKKVYIASKKWKPNLSWQSKIIRRISKGFILKIRPQWLILAVIFIVFACFVKLLVQFKNPEAVFTRNLISIPKINIVQIAPNDPSSKNTLCVNVDNIRDEISLRYRWYKDNIEIKGAESKCLSNSYFGKGDLIKAKVTPFAGKIEGESITSRPVRIKNSSPTIRSVTIDPETIYANTDISVDVDAEDQDHDSIRFLYQWIKNGSIIANQESESLPQSEFIKGDRIQIEVTPFDGEHYGVSMRSGSFIVNNSPPEIISRPPVSLDQNGAFVYRIIAEDIDKDTITFSIPSNNPKGVKIDSKSGLLTWRIPGNIKPGDYRVEIIANDNDGGEASQWFNLNIRFN